MTFRIDGIPATAQEDKGFLIHHFASVALALTSMVISSGGNTFMAGAPGSVNMRTAIRYSWTCCGRFPGRHERTLLTYTWYT
jgi:hypothetical protein